MRRLAAIDIGTNTVRLLIVQADASGRWRELFKLQEITRLGEGLYQSGMLRREAMERTLNTLTHFISRAAGLKVNKLLTMATSAVREAVNGVEFVQLVKEHTGLEVEVIPPEKEARLALGGVLGALKTDSRRILVIDIGGGSTEFILAEQGRLVKFWGLRIGVVKLKERFLHHDPPHETEYRQLCGYLDRELEPLDFPQTDAPELVGIAGTPTTLAAIDQQLPVYDPAKINNYLLSKTRIETLQRTFLSQTNAQRQLILGLEPGRADVIIPGTALLWRLMEKLGYSVCRTCDHGLREGILQELIAREILSQT